MTEKKIRHFTYYFRRMMKFYDLKAKAVPQVLFVLLLIISFGFRIAAQPMVMDFTIYLQQMVNTYRDMFSSGNLNDPSFIESIIEFQKSDLFIQVITISLKVIGLVFLQQILMMMLSFFYLGGYLCDLESEGSSFSCYRRKLTKALPRFIGFNLLFYLALIVLFSVVIFFLSLATVILPMFYFVMNFVTFLLPVGWFIIQVIFIFKDITFLDTGIGIWLNFKLSIRLSAGNRMMIARNIFFIAFLNLVIGMVTVESQIISMFIISFLEVIILLIKQRLIALMYLNRTRKPMKSPEQN